MSLESLTQSEIGHLIALHVGGSGSDGTKFEPLSAPALK
jgi:hypothetical protein